MSAIQTTSHDYQTLATELIEAKKVIEKFINCCSHSLRSPIKTIQGLAYVLEQHDPSENDSKKLLKLIDDTALKMENVLTQLEQFLQNSKKEIVKESLDLDQLVRGVVLDYQHSLKARSIDLTVEVEQSQPFFSDSGKLRFILSQIVLNAIQFYDNEKTRSFINIKVNVLSSSCEISILDNGIGIQQESQDKIFQLFYRGSDKAQGPGIGLYAARVIIDKMGGKISVDSRLHHGTKFFLWVPSQAA